jgi:hypothetical protein
MIWQEDEPRIVTWLINAVGHGGGFVHSFAEAAMRSDAENYPIVRPALLQLLAKYPEYAKERI